MEKYKTLKEIEEVQRYSQTWPIDLHPDTINGKEVSVDVENLAKQKGNLLDLERILEEYQIYQKDVRVLLNEQRKEIVELKSKLKESAREILALQKLYVDTLKKLETYEDKGDEHQTFRQEDLV